MGKQFISHGEGGQNHATFLFMEQVQDMIEEVCFFFFLQGKEVTKTMNGI